MPAEIAHHADRLPGARLGIPSHQPTGIEHSLDRVLRLNVHRAAVAIRPPQVRFIRDIDGVDRQPLNR